MVFDGSIDGRSWNEAVEFKTQLRIDIAQALAHVHGQIGILSTACSLFKPTFNEEMALRVKIGRIEIDDFSVEITYSGCNTIHVSPDRLVEEMSALVESHRLRGQWTGFAHEHAEVDRLFIGICRADAKKMRLVLKNLWNNTFLLKGRQVAAMKRLNYSSCLLVARAFQALQQGAKASRSSAGESYLDSCANSSETPSTVFGVQRRIPST